MAQGDWKSRETDWEASSESTQVNSSPHQLSCAPQIPGYTAEVSLGWSTTDCGTVYEMILSMQRFESSQHLGKL